MGKSPDVAAEGVDRGKVYYCTPVPPRAKRSRKEADASSSGRPWWVPERDMGSRPDAAATEKRIVCTAYRKLNEWVGRWGADAGDSAIRRGDTRFAENQHAPIREIAANLRGVSAATVGKYWGEMQGNQGVLTSEKARGPAGKKR